MAGYHVKSDDTSTFRVILTTTPPLCRCLYVVIWFLLNTTCEMSASLGSHIKLLHVPLNGNSQSYCVFRSAISF